jgi:nicotinamidase-related amidase
MRFNLENTLAILIDFQERLFPHIDKHTKLLKNTTIALKGLQLFEVPIIITEQYVKGLGPTVAALEEIGLSAYPRFEKTTFSLAKDKNTIEYLHKQPQKNILLLGIEAHVCVLQSALDIQQMGYNVGVVWDCVGSRKEEDKKISKHRFLSHGIEILSYESILFELCEDSKNQSFKNLSNLLK